MATGGGPPNDINGLDESVAEDCSISSQRSKKKRRPKLAMDTDATRQWYDQYQAQTQGQDVPQRTPVASPRASPSPASRASSPSHARRTSSPSELRRASSPSQARRASSPTSANRASPSLVSRKSPAIAQKTPSTREDLQDLQAFYDRTRQSRQFTPSAETEFIPTLVIPGRQIPGQEDGDVTLSECLEGVDGHIQRIEYLLKTATDPASEVAQRHLLKIVDVAKEIVEIHASQQVGLDYSFRENAENIIKVILYCKEAGWSYLENAFTEVNDLVEAMRFAIDWWKIQVLYGKDGK